MEPTKKLSPKLRHFPYASVPALMFSKVADKYIEFAILLTPCMIYSTPSSKRSFPRDILRTNVLKQQHQTMSSSAQRDFLWFAGQINNNNKYIYIRSVSVSVDTLYFH